MMYYLDTEFNEFGGELISLALVREDGESLYLVYPAPEEGYKPWVEKNVVPILWSIPKTLPGMAHTVNSVEEGGRLIANFLSMDPGIPYIVSDWPDDIRYFCQAIITGPGTMVNIARIKFDIVRVDAYPSNIKMAVQHNAWWDAMALRDILT